MKLSNLGEDNTKRLIKTIKFIIEGYRDGNVRFNDADIEFDMSIFAAREFEIELTNPQDANECATNCCFLGFGACLYHDILVGGEVDNWSGVAAELYGIYYTDKAWDFLFSGGIQSDPIELANRVLHFIETGETNPFLFRRIGRDEVIRRLDELLS